VIDEKRVDPANNSGAYVLNALDQNEQAEFESQLDVSEQLRNEVTELTDTAVLLGMAVAPVQPPAALKANIMAKLGTTPQLSREVLASAPPSSLDRRVQVRWFQKPAMVAAAAVVAILIVSGGAIGITAATEHIQQEQQADALAAINSAPDSQRAEASVSSGGTATLVWSQALGKSALIVKGLSPLPSDKTYELWYIDANGEPRRAGLLSGSSTWHVLDGRMAKGDTIGVTIEPSGGSNSPTTKPIVAIAST
jgi:anti-sigma-K factor RskA